MGGAHVRSVDALNRLRTALLVFRQSTISIAPSLRIRVERARSKLDLERRRLDAEIDALQEQMTSNEDCEGESVGRALDDAYAARERVSDQSRRLSAAAALHDRSSSSWIRALSGTVPAAAAFLAQKHADALNYLQARLTGVDATTPTVRTVHEDTATPLESAHALSDPIHASAPEDLPTLPAGFSWIPITQIPESDLPDRNAYPKVGYDTMRTGLARLWTEVLPILGSTPDADRTTFQEFDLRHGRVDRMGFVHDESLTHIWDQFFEKRFHNYVRVSFQSSTGRWSVDNGRHRIRVARDLGWKYLPGELLLEPA